MEKGMKLTNALGSGMVERPSSDARLALRSSIHGTMQTGWGYAVLARATINCSICKQSSVTRLLVHEKHAYVQIHAVLF